MNTNELLAQAAKAADATDWDTAANFLEELPPTKENLHIRGWYRSRAKRYDAAIADYTELCKQHPNDYFPQYMLGFQHYEQQKWEVAVAYFDEALDRKPDHIKSLWRRAYALHRLGRDAKAAVTANRLRRVWLSLPEEQRQEDRRRYAQACHLIGRYQVGHDPEGAILLLREAAMYEPTDPYHHYQLAKALRCAGHLKEAAQTIRNARKLKPNDVSIELEFIAVLSDEGASSQAENHLIRLQCRCSGWYAYRAGKLAIGLNSPQLAVGFFVRASHHHDTRGQSCVLMALANAEQLLKTSSALNGQIQTRRPSKSPRRHQPQSSSAADISTAELLGVVDLVQRDRNFGFLVDDSGVRRHFRIVRDQIVHKGERVKFEATTAPKGPAAQNVRPA